MPEPKPDVDMDYENNLVAAGALLMLLQSSGYSSIDSIVPVVDADGIATNQIDISLSFLRSSYRVTVERIDG